MVEPLSTIATIGTLYFLPSIIAGMKRKENAISILILNIFLGWTILGWIGALIWAYTGTPSPRAAAWDKEFEQEVRHKGYREALFSKRTAEEKRRNNRIGEKGRKKKK